RLRELGMGAQERLRGGRGALDAFAVARGDRIAAAVEELLDGLGLGGVDGDRRGPLVAGHDQRQAVGLRPARQRPQLRRARRLRRDPYERRRGIRRHSLAFFFACGAAFLPPSSAMAPRTDSACPSTLTLFQMRATVPSGATRHVDRGVPSISFPYIIFLPQAA